MDSGKTRNVILITVDCLRADRVGSIAGGALTPSIDKLARDSVVFRRAFANGPGTNQSFPAILTSTYFLMHGGMRLVQSCGTLAEVLFNNGFKTVAFHSNPFLSGSLGWSRGFNEFHDFLDVLKSPSAAVTRLSFTAKLARFLNRATRVLSSKRIQSFLRRVYYEWSELEIPYVEGNQLNKYVIDWISSNKETPFFLWMHYMDPHRPYVPPPYYSDYPCSRKEAFDFDLSVDPHLARGEVSEDELRRLKTLYAGEARYVDDCIGKLVEFLEAKGVMEDAILVLSADHGEAFGEHKKFAHAYDMLYNEVLHVPLIMHGLPGCSSEVVGDYVQLLDLAPTILEALGIRKPDSFIGHSIMEVIQENRSRPIFSESAKPDLIDVRYDTSKKVVSCISGRWKLIVNELWGTTELFNLEEDFLEKDNAIEDEREICAELGSLIENHLLTHPRLGIGEVFEDTEKGRIMRRLRSLGYMQ